MKTPLIVLYDGQCTLCTLFQQWMRRCDLFHAVLFVDLHDEVKRKSVAPSLLLSDLLRAIHCIRLDGVISIGVDAIADILSAPLLTRPLGFFLRLFLFLPYGRVMAHQSYAWIARHRCASEYCRIDGSSIE